MDISTVMIANINMFHSSLDDSIGAICKCAFILAENRKRLGIVVFDDFDVFDVFAVFVVSIVPFEMIIWHP
jgi:hypothetical protein